MSNKNRKYDLTPKSPYRKKPWYTRWFYELRRWYKSDKQKKS